MIFREATTEDFAYMDEHTLNKEGYQKYLAETNYVFTLEHEGNPLGIGGFRIIVPTTAWCWLDLTEGAIKNIYTSYRVINNWMKTFVENQDIVRLQAFVKDEEKYIRLVEHLGFTKESIMEKFYGDSDALLYKRIF